MAIAFVKAEYTATTSGTNITFNVSSGSNRILLIGGFGSSALTAASSTVGGNATTDSGAGIITHPTYSNKTYLHYYLNPPSGDNTIVVTQTGYSTVLVWIAEYTGVAQQAPADFDSGSGSNTSFTTTAVTRNTGGWVIMKARNDLGPTAWPGGANTTIRGTANSLNFADSNGGAVTQLNSGTFSNGPYGYIVISLDVAPPGPANLKSLNTNLKANIKSYNTNLIANCKSLNTNV
jgi:hypothetical protein